MRCVEVEMNKWTYLAAAAATAAVTTAAVAADLPRSNYYAPAPVAPLVHNWTGAYAGVNIGYQWGDVTNNPTSPAGVMGGLQLGYNWQNNQFVYGVETDLQISGAEDTFAPWKFENPWFGTVRGRLGYAFNKFMVYGTGGLAYGTVRGTVAGLDESHTQLGWTIGLGAEVALNKAWSAKVEYLYVDLANRSYSVTGADNGLESNLLRFGVNYHF
jgi:outer membrane immunogenic protein